MVRRSSWMLALGVGLFLAGTPQPASVHTAAAADRQQPAPRRIIDVHMHAYVDDARFGSRFTNPLTGEVMVAALNVGAHTSACRASMDRLNIVKAVVSGGDHKGVLQWKQLMADRVLVGNAFDNPANANLDFLRQEHGAGRLDVIGEIAPIYEGIAPDDPRLEPFFALADELDVPVGFHVHPGPPGGPYGGFPRLRARLGDPLLLEDALVRHPKMRLYVMHAGWPYLDRMIALLATHPQVYVEVGAIHWGLPKPEFDRFLRGLVDAGFGQRIMFGSDQMVWCDRMERGVRAIDSADYLTPQQKDDIFFNNAVRFFRLDPKATLQRRPSAGQPAG